MTKKYNYDVLLDSSTAPAKLLNLVGKNKSVLEIGCASGVQSKILTEVLCCKVTGVEIDKDAANEAKSFCEHLIVGDVEKIDLNELLRGRIFDVITFADVLEHLQNPEVVLESIKPLLSDDGFVVASVPNIVHVSVLFEMMNGNFDYKKYGLLDDTHVRFFTKKTMCQMFERAGFYISHIDRATAPSNEEIPSLFGLMKEDLLVLNYMKERNLENDTYQFIVKANKMTDKNRPILSSFISMEDENSLLKRRLKQISIDNEKLNSELNWLENKTYYSIKRKIKHFLRKR